MPLCDFCLDSNKAFDFSLGTAYHSAQDGSVKTIFRIQIPFSSDRQLVEHKRRGVPQEKRLVFYQDIVRCVQRQITVSKYLTQANVNSVLSYTTVEQEKTEDGSTVLYLECSQQVWPVLQHLLVGSVPALTVLDVISRLALILRDIAREPVGVIHRGLNLNEVYISADNKILLGGFYYAACPKLGAFPDFLPGGPANIPAAVWQGNPGSHKTDIQSLSAIAWNLFSGLPHDCEILTQRRTVPEFSFPELDNALLLGLAGEDEICNAFRRRLSDCRKLLNKPDSPQIAVPIRQQKLKEFRVNLV